MKLYVTRHGETDWNVQGRVCGTTDVELTEKGREQARRLAESLDGRDIGLIISSPMKRALETSRIIAAGRDIPIKTDIRLIEQDYGVYEGTNWRDEKFQENKRNFAYRYPGGESMMDVAYRTYGLIKELKEKRRPVLLVCHGGVCRVMNTYFRDMTNEEFFRYSLGNCGLEEYEL